MHIFAINSITHNQNQNPLLDLLWYSPDIIYKRWVFLLLNVPITGLCNFPANFFSRNIFICRRSGSIRCFFVIEICRTLKQVHLWHWCPSFGGSFRNIRCFITLCFISSYSSIKIFKISRSHIILKTTFIWFALINISWISPITLIFLILSLFLLIGLQASHINPSCFK